MPSSARRGTARSRWTGSSCRTSCGPTLRIPIGLAFLFRSSATGGVAAFYPSPAGATESELDLAAWAELELANPVLQTLEADAEALIVNRLSDPAQFAIAPIDRCYGLVGLVKLRWQGINGGPDLPQAIQSWFDELRAKGRSARSPWPCPLRS